jgi:thiol-disulfide isomerase/thioredoxin
MIRSLFFIFLIVLAGCSSQKGEEQSAIVASQIKLTDLEGKEVDLTELAGKTIFVNFWATWCKPCIQEMPSIISLREQLAGQNIEFYFASDEEADKVKKFMKSRRMSSGFVQVKNLESLGIQALPTTFIFDGQGNLVFSEAGLRKWDEPAMVEMVTKLINE